MSHRPPRRGKRKGTLSAFHEQNEQSRRMKKNRGKDEDDPFDSVNLIAGALDAADIDMRGILARFYGMPGHFEPPPPLPRRKSTEGIAAYRTWRVCKERNGAIGLASTAHDFLWDGPVLRDKNPPAEREHGTENIGIHAYKNVTNASHHGGGFGFHNAFGGNIIISGNFFSVKSNEPPAPPRLTFLGGSVLGEVLLFGTVVVHEGGYRAQAAMIRSLYVPLDTFAQHEGIADTLAARYGCDVHTDHAKWIGGCHGNDR